MIIVCDADPYDARPKVFHQTDKAVAGNQPGWEARGHDELNEGVSRMGMLCRVPRGALDNKPPHGSPCTRCGVCCMATLCPLAVSVFGEGPGPCPALYKDADGYGCGLVRVSTGEMREAALLLIGSGYGCDARFNGEPVNHEFNRQLEQRDVDKAAEIAAARKLWRVK